jgi:hypothetical protein
VFPTTVVGGYIIYGTPQSFTATRIIARSSNTSLTVANSQTVPAGTPYVIYYVYPNANTAVGYNAANVLISGANNTVYGYQGGLALRSGSNNLFAGYNAATSVQTGSSNVVLGASAAIGVQQTNTVVVGQGASATADGATAIGQGVTANIADGFFIRKRGPAAFVTNAAGFLAGGELVEVSSSVRTKENIRDLELAGDKFEALRPVRYTPKLVGGLQPSEVRENIGFIAEEIAEIYPEVVSYDRDGEPAGLMYERLVPVIVRELQKLRQELRELRGE